MFTGIVDHCGVVKEAKKTERSLLLKIESRFEDLIEGESISVDGACLTVIRPEGSDFLCDLSLETLNLTIASRYAAGRRVNLERAMRLSDRIGGHIVTGHIDGMGKVDSVDTVESFVRMSFTGIDGEFRRYLMRKGSVCVNGVSLTVNEVTPRGFSVMLIPHTLERTNLGELTGESPVNLELDWLMKVFLNDKEEAWKKH